MKSTKIIRMAALAGLVLLLIGAAAKPKVYFSNGLDMEVYSAYLRENF
jgi:hypothetical protein